MKKEFLALLIFSAMYICAAAQNPNTANPDSVNARPADILSPAGAKDRKQDKMINKGVMENDTHMRRSNQTHSRNLMMHENKELKDSMTIRRTDAWKDTSPLAWPIHDSSAHKKLIRKDPALKSPSDTMILIKDKK